MHNFSPFFQSHSVTTKPHHYQEFHSRTRRDFIFKQSGFESNRGISQDPAGAGSGEFFATFVKTIQVIFNLLRLLFLVQHRQSLHKLGDAENRKLAGSPFAQKVSGWGSITEPCCAVQQQKSETRKTTLVLIFWCAINLSPIPQWWTSFFLQWWSDEGAASWGDGGHPWRAQATPSPPRWGSPAGRSGKNTLKKRFKAEKGTGSL